MIRPPTSRIGGDRAPSIVHVEPGDGLVGVFRDAPVIVRVSHPLDERSLEQAEVLVRGPYGPVPGGLRLAGAGDVLVWTPAEPLLGDAPHFLVLRALHDRRGRALAPHVSRFVTWAFCQADLAGCVPRDRLG